MRILLDECVNPQVRRAFPTHTVRTVVDMGWRTQKDKVLFRQVPGRFDVFVTLDQGLEHEQHIAALSFAVVVAHVADNRLEGWLPILAELNEACERSSPGTVTHVCP